jgi:hypothetical protein
MAGIEKISDVEAGIAADFDASMEDIAAGRTVSFDPVISRLDKRIRRVQDSQRETRVLTPGRK